MAGIVAVPAAITALSPLFERRREALWQPLGPVNDFPVGDMQRAVFERTRPGDPSRSLRERDVYVLREASDEITVFSRRCTDLGCGVIWDPGSACFFCPCHGGIFATTGERMAGPPQRDLYQYDARVENGILEIDLRSLPPMA